MKKRLSLLFSLFLATTLFAQKAPLRRADSFFGLHFDFHASINDSLVGKTLSEGMIDSLLTAVKPDFIQVDSKGHPGVTSYPTKVAAGTQVKSFTQDPLALFRKVTQKHGVALYVHYSGVYDDAALQKYPEWAAIDANGKPSTQKTSVHGAYVDELMIPQLKEIADYGVDGVWVDGDCWATVLDYSPKALEKFRQQTGISTIPKTKQDEHYLDLMNFARQSFKNYVGHYTDQLHQYKPSFQVASNWAFSSFMPEPVDLNIDFMSGDLTPMNGVNSALFEARVLAAQSRTYKKPWDLMSWSFNTAWNTSNHGAKTALNLSQEIAEVIAMGGSYQCYFTQNRDASIRTQQVKTMAELAEFARARQAYTQGATAIPQIALLYSLASFKKYNSSIYNNSAAEPVKAILTALMDGQNAVEVLSEHHLKGRLDQYPLVIIPEWIYLEPDFLQELKTYAQNGGKLLVIGAEAVKNFSAELGIELNGVAQKQLCWVASNGDLGLVNDLLQKVSLKAGTPA
ncbi:MAG TPA: alpha-L-fucosidase, partial [Haliscomenobacter sp.]|nr:alpha-L-fucosidase [Haliscomenobacter sp.]